MSELTSHKIFWNHFYLLINIYAYPIMQKVVWNMFWDNKTQRQTSYQMSSCNYYVQVFFLIPQALDEAEFFKWSLFYNLLSTLQKKKCMHFCTFTNDVMTWQMPWNDWESNWFQFNWISTRCFQRQLQSTARSGNTHLLM